MSNITQLYLQKQAIDRQIRERRQAMLELVERTIPMHHEVYGEVKTLINRIKMSHNKQEVDDLYDVFYLYVMDYNLIK
jgi:chaperonin cofactor prefoldin